MKFELEDFRALYWYPPN